MSEANHGAGPGPGAAVPQAVHECIRRLADRMREVLWVSNADCTRIVYISPAYETIWGRSCESLRANPRGWLEAIHPEDRPRVAKAFLQVPRELVEEVYRVVRPDGSLRWVRDRGVTIEGLAGEPLIAGIAEDITEVQVTLEAQQRSDDLLRLFSGNVRDVFFLVEPRGKRVLYVSPAYETIWGRTCRSLYEEPTSWLDAVHEDDRERIRASSIATTGRIAQEMTFRIVRPDGSIRWIRDRTFDARDESGALRLIAGVAADVTELKEAEDQLRRSEARLHQSEKLDAIGRLAGGVAHDFNNHLAAILAYADLALGRGSLAAAAGDLEEIRRAASRAGELSQKLLAFSRQRPIEPRSVALNASIRDMHRMLERLVGEDVEITAALDPQAGSVIVDPGQLEQVLLNLAVNARDAMPQGGRLTIATSLLPEGSPGAPVGEAPHGWAVLRVADTGEGVDQRVKQRLFEPFVTTKPEGRGTGLGLSIVYGIVRQAGGHIAVDSEPAKGAAITIHLPRVPSEPEPNGSEVGAVRRGTERVLVVEDSAPLREAMKAGLAQGGYRVTAAASGPEALAVAGESPEPFELLVTDIVMPRMRGEELASILLERWPGLRVIFVSGFAGEACGRMEGAFLQKPFSISTLAGKVRELVDASG